MRYRQNHANGMRLTCFITLKKTFLFDMRAQGRVDMTQWISVLYNLNFLILIEPGHACAAWTINNKIAVGITTQALNLCHIM